MPAVAGGARLDTSPGSADRSRPSRSSIPMARPVRSLWIGAKIRQDTGSQSPEGSGANCISPPATPSRRRSGRLRCSKVSRLSASVFGSSSIVPATSTSFPFFAGSKTSVIPVESSACLPRRKQCDWRNQSADRTLTSGPYQTRPSWKLTNPSAMNPTRLSESGSTAWIGQVTIAPRLVSAVTIESPRPARAIRCTASIRKPPLPSSVAAITSSEVRAPSSSLVSTDDSPPSEPQRPASPRTSSSWRVTTAGSSTTSGSRISPRTSKAGSCRGA